MQVLKKSNEFDVDLGGNNVFIKQYIVYMGVRSFPAIAAILKTVYDLYKQYGSR